MIYMEIVISNQYSTNIQQTFNKIYKKSMNVS